MEGLARVSNGRRFDKIGYKIKVMFSITSQNRVFGMKFMWECENSCSEYLRYLFILGEA
jgi:hypothetical protein